MPPCVVTAGLVEFKPPTAGMFVWMRIIGIEDSFKVVTDLAKNNKVLFTALAQWSCASTFPSPSVTQTVTFVGTSTAYPHAYCG